MNTKRIWRREVEERRGERRVAADFYAIEVDGGARYLRRVTNVSADGLLLENPLADDRPGQIVELALPLTRGGENDNAGAPTEAEAGGEVRVQAEVVYVTDDGHVGLRVTSQSLPVDELGGHLPL
jgi:hypothetical protein